MSRRVQLAAKSATGLLGLMLLAAGLGGCERGGTAASLKADAVSYAQKGDSAAALIQARNAVAKAPDNAELRLLLGNLYLDNYDAASAEKEFRKADALGAPRQPVAIGLSRSLLGQYQFAKVLEETEASAGTHDPDLTLLRADAMLALKRNSEAREAYEAVLKARPGSIQALSGMARYAFGQNDMAAANAYAEQAIAKNPDDVDVWMFNGGLLHAQGKRDLARAAYDKVLQLKPNHKTAWLEKALVDIESKRFDEAKKDIAAATKNDPTNLQSLHTQALLDYSQGNLEAARGGLQKLLSLVPDHLPSSLLAGLVEMRLGANESSTRHFRKYLEAYPQNTMARQLMVSQLLATGKINEAQVMLRPALQEENPAPTLLALAGQVYLQAGDYKQASAYLERASAAAPDAAGVHVALGMSKLGLGDATRGMSELQLATTLDAGSAKAALALASIQLRNKDYAKALVTLGTLEKLQPENAYVQNLKGAAYAKMKNVAAARGAFEHALELQSNYLVAAVNLAQLDLEENKPAAAKARYEAFLAKNPGHPGVMAVLADMARAQGDVEGALNWLRRAQSENPNDLAPAIRLAYAYLLAGKPSDGLVLARKFQVAHSTNTELLDLLGHLQIALQDGVGAVETYSKLAAVLPKNADVQFRLSTAQFLVNNESAAAFHLKRAIALRPDFKEAQFAQLQMWARKGEVDEAIRAAVQLQKQYPKDPLPYSIEGSLLTTQKQPAAALKAFERAYALEKSSSTLIRIHAALVQAGDEKQADARMAQWQKDHPEDLHTRLYLAEAMIARKQFAKAIVQLEALLKSNPQNVVALNNLAWAYHQVSDARAVATAEQAYKLTNANPAVGDTLGWILVEQGKFERGLPILEAAAKASPAALDIRMHLATALAKSGNKDRARKELGVIIAKGKSGAQYQPAQDLLKQL